MSHDAHEDGRRVGGEGGDDDASGDGSENWTLPPDLLAVVALVVLADVVVLAFELLAPGVVPVAVETSLRVLVGVPTMLFAPGYALVACLFPEAATPASDDRRWLAGSGVGHVERVALSVAASVVAVPATGVLLALAGVGIRPAPVAVGLSAVTFVAAGLAARRRAALPPSQRFRVPRLRREAPSGTDASVGERRPSRVAVLALAVSVVVLAATVSFAVAVPPAGAQYTEFYLLSEQPNGTAVAGDYPTQFVRGEGRPMSVAVENHEGRATNYTVVALVQRVENGTVTRSTEVDRFRTRVAADETSVTERTVAPTETGERLRLQFLLYEGDPPARPAASNAKETLHLWVTVREAGTG